MRFLRYLLGALLGVIGLLRLRLVLVLLGSPSTYKIRDTFTYYLMAKAISLGESPYQPLNVMASRYFGVPQFMAHPAPCTPFTAIMSLPLLFFPVDKAYIAWFCLEMLCLVLIAIMLPNLIYGKTNWKLTAVLLVLMLSWYPVMVELLLGQLTILLTTLLLAALLALKRDKKILTGILTGLTVAIKMYTWPLVIYYAVKKEWKIFISCCVTIAITNFLAFLVIGFGPFMEYYLKVTLQVSAVYHSYMRNYSIWSIGYRLFEGTHGTSSEFLSAPPLINLPQVAPIFSVVLALLCLVVGLTCALKTRDKDVAYSMMLCVIVAVSPITWDHYYFMLVIALVVLANQLLKGAARHQLVVSFAVVAVMLYFLNEYIGPALIALNGGSALVQANGNQISFASSLLETLPVLELVFLAILIWRTATTRQKTGPSPSML